MKYSFPLNVLKGKKLNNFRTTSKDEVSKAGVCREAAENTRTSSNAMRAGEIEFEVGSVVDCAYTSPIESALCIVVRLTSGREFTLNLTERASFELRNGVVRLGPDRGSEPDRESVQLDVAGEKIPCAQRA